MLLILFSTDAASTTQTVIETTGVETTTTAFTDTTETTEISATATTEEVTVTDVNTLSSTEFSAGTDITTDLNTLSSTEIYAGTDITTQESVNSTYDGENTTSLFNNGTLWGPEDSAIQSCPNIFVMAFISFIISLFLLN